MQRQQKITLGEMRQSGPRRLLVCCGDYHCAHSVVVSADPWGDAVRLPIGHVALMAVSAAHAKKAAAGAWSATASPSTKPHFRVTCAVPSQDHQKRHEPKIRRLRRR